MNSIKRHLVPRTVAAFAVAIGVLALLAMATTANAQEAGVSIDDATGATGAEVTVELSASDVGAPGLGAWSIDIIYDDSIVTAESCDADVSGATNVCNEDFASDTVRVAGASATGLEGDSTLLEITFDCDANGTSPLEISIEHFADATIGGPQPIDVTASDGSITCSAAGLPSAGTGGRSDNGMLYIGMGLLAAVGLAAVGRGLVGSRSA